MENSNPIPKKKLFICKFCNKKYPCGKSLGGHIRIHLNGNGNVNSTDLEEEKDPESPAQSGGYVLRENPKKTRRFMADSTTGTNHLLLQGKICKECGKGFQSLKALCGHMASHSKNSFEDHSEATEKLKAQVFDSQSDTETSSAAPSKRRRSTRMRYRAIDVYSGSLSSATDDNIEEEHEEVALCLMMLSKDSGFKGCFSSSIADYSDNNSVFSSPKLRISVKNGTNCVDNGNGFSENSDPGYFKNGPKKVESEISANGFTGNDELGKRLSRFRRVKTELGKDLIDEDGKYEEPDRISRKRSKNYDSCNPEIGTNKASTASKCSSGVANRRTNGFSELIHESGENNIETDSISKKKIQSGNGKSPIEQNLSDKKLGLKKGKVHECPFCFKVFRSGQAVGGHKRSHFVGGAEDRTVVIDQQMPEVSMSRLIDLNLPAPMEEDNTNGHCLSSW